MALALGAMVVAFALAELLVRVLGAAPRLVRILVDEQQSLYQRSNNPILGYELKPGAKLQDTTGPTKRRINADGYWGPRREIVKPANVARIVMLGDSVVANEAVTDYDNTITGQLERMLSGRAKRFEVINFGVSSYCTLAEIESLRVKGLQYAPDLVIVVFVWNDYDNFNNGIGLVTQTRPRWVQWLFVRSHLFRVGSVRLNLFDLRAQYRMPQIDREPATASQRRRRWMLTQHRRTSVYRHVEAIGENNVEVGLALLRQLADEHGFEVLIAIWPDFTDTGIFDIEDREHYPAPHLPGQNAKDENEPLVIELLAKRYGFTTARMSRAFKDDYASREGNEPLVRYYTDGDGMHANERGSRVAAKALVDLIERHTRLLE